MAMQDEKTVLFEALIRRLVKDCVDLDRVKELEEWLAMEYARIPGMTDARILELARGAIACAFRQIGEGDGTTYHDELDRRTRYLNAICAEVEHDFEARG